MEKLNFDYKKIIEQSDSINSVSEKISYLKKVLAQLDESVSSIKSLEEKPDMLTPEERVEYFEKVNLKKLIRTKIFLEELK
ncbi:MAG: hypothetical protein R6W90_05130 [Ignavibacteriaceae bacterium]